MKNIKEMKTRLKELGADIRQTRANLKNSQRQHSSEVCSLEDKLRSDKMLYRSRHIAYGIIRGKQYSEIERKCYEGNTPDWSSINNIISDFEKESK